LESSVKVGESVKASESVKVGESPSPSESPSPKPSESPSPSNSSNADPKAAITEAAAVESLQPKLYDQIDKAWQVSPAFNEDLRYRVQVNREGTIVSYKPDNRAATDYENEIPLPKLSKGKPGETDGTASFQVVFRPSGKLEINPWFGYNKP
jgi:hypothetical protein